MKNTIQRILLAEDNAEHYINFIQAINAISPTIDVMRVEDGYSLLSMLETQQKPQAIFLDIDMPYKGGLQILEEIRGRKDMEGTPVLILSASAYDLVLKVSYQLGAILFVRKYNRSEDLRKCLEAVFNNNYFLNCEQAPWEEYLIE